MISTFHKDHPEKLIATSLLLDSTPPMAKPSVKPAKASAKQKQGRPTSSTKQAKEWDIGQWDFSFSILVRLESFFTNSMSFKKDAYSASSSNSVSSLSISSILPLCLLSMSNTLPLCFLSMSGTLPPIFRFSSSVSYWVRRFFIRLILRFSFLVSHWVRRFFIHHALSTKLRKLYLCMLTRSAELVF